MNWKKTRSSQEQKPLEVDTNSSSKTIYLRKDIQKKTEVIEDKAITYWEYLELEIPKGQNDAIVMLCGELIKATDSLNTIMLALADIYEKLEA